MKVLHTSDWHLGQQFYDHSRLEEQQAFLAWLVETLEGEQIDLLLVSGDVFHTATPSAQAEQMLYDFIKSVKATCPQTHLIFIAGNHDSPARIETAKPLLERFDSHVIGRFDRKDPSRVVVSLKIHSENVFVVAMPFLRPSDINASQDELSRYENAVRMAYEQACATIECNEPYTLICMGHLHAKGGDISQDSERNLCIGGFDSVSASIFPPDANYVALGHLHKAQMVAGSEAIRYCGTPMPMSFAEKNYKHQALALTFSNSQLESVKPLYIPRYKELIQVPAKGALMLDALCEELKALQIDAASPTPFLRLRMDAKETDSQFRAKIDEAMKHLNVHFCGIERVSTSEQGPVESAMFDIEQAKEVTVRQLLEFAYHSQIDSEAEIPEQLGSLLDQLVMELDENEQ